jgi:hypothetical protein
VATLPGESWDRVRVSGGDRQREIIETVHVRKAPTISAHAGLRLQASLRVPSAFGASKLIAFGLRMTVASGSGERIAVARRPE